VHNTCKIIKMKTRTYKKVLQRKENNIIQEDDENENRKRQSQDYPRVSKRSKKDKYPWFRINYKRSHTPLRLSNTSLNEACCLSGDLEEEQSIQLIPYKKYFSFKSYSFLELWKLTEDLFEHYEEQHKMFKIKKVSKATEINKLDSLSSQDVENEKIKLACSGNTSVYTNRALSKMFGVKYSQLNRCLQKKEQNIEPIIRKRGRKTKMLPQSSTLLTLI